MRLYNCKVRLKSSLYNEVPKDNVTAAEIIILQHLHRPDGGEEGAIDPSTVTDIKFSGDAERSEAEERSRLQSAYGVALAKMKLNLPMLFGAGGVPLPNTVEGVSVAEAPIMAKRGPGRPKKEWTPSPDAKEVLEPDAEAVAAA